MEHMKRVCIVGAGISGLATCKHLVTKGFRPVVFEADRTVGGVWTRTPASTRLQTARWDFQFPDFPWPEKVTEVCPDNKQVMEYIESYARRFDLLRHVRFGEKVVAVDYVGVGEDEMQAWDLWGGTGDAFGGGRRGVWHVTVQCEKDGTVERWIFSKFTESYLMKTIPMKKYGMVPEHSFFQGLSSGLLCVLPENFYDKVAEGSIILKPFKNFEFWKYDVHTEGETTPIETELVIYATGFKGDQKLRNIFISPWFQKIVAGSEDMIVPLYRECIHPQIPQMAIIGYSESISNLYTSEMRAMWLACFLDDGFMLPSKRIMEKNIMEWEKYFKKYSGSSSNYYRRSCITPIHTWYCDQLCKDMGCNPRRKKGFFADLFLPYGPTDYDELEFKKQ